MAILNQVITDQYAIYNGDCVEVMSQIPDDSIHMTIYSPPFGGLYSYSSDDRDLSNNPDYDSFCEHYRYVIREKHRITMPGRISAVHCTDIPSSNSGKDHLIDLPGDIIRLHAECGFKYIARHTIWKEPLWVRNRTMTKNLAHKTIVDDAVYAGVASADYLLIFRKEGTNPVPVTHNTGLPGYAGETPIPSDLLGYKHYQGKQTENRYSHWIWRQYASSVWDDIRMQNVLPFKDSKDEDDEKHVHPLQLDVIERAVALRTNPGETVFTPFMGVGSEVYIPVKLGRRGIGAELKESYFKQARLNLESAVSDAQQSDLFAA